MGNLIEIPVEVILKGIDEAMSQSQDLSLINRKTAYVNHALTFIALSGARDMIKSFADRGIKFYAPESVAKEMGVNVGS